MTVISNNESATVLYTLSNGEELEVTCVELFGEDFGYRRCSKTFERALACYIAVSDARKDVSHSG